MIGYDLDGVICPEVYFDIKIMSLDELFNIRDLVLANFIPKKDSIIITGRPESDRDRTVKWLTKNNIVVDDIIFKPNECPFSFDAIVKHKCDTINRLFSKGLEMFIESEEKQVNYLSKYCIVPIYHFASIINDSIKTKGIK